MTLLHHLVKHPSGEFTESVEGREVRAGQTLSCAHCGKVFEVRPGSRRERGWCLRCNGPTCGDRGCQTCTPFERKIEAMERRALLRNKVEANWRHG